jgi:peptidoglycan/xylan/chitin deacetylase (PgdA/CDA1 family)
MVNIIIRIDDICDRYDFYDLRKWFIENYPQIPISFYVTDSHFSYKWGAELWRNVKNVITNYKWEIGGHSRNHYHLPELTEQELVNEIIKNIEDIEKGLRSVGLDYKITSFAYPFGEFNENVKSILKRGGIIHGLTYESGDNYKSLIKFPKNNLYEIGISCNATNSVHDWNLRFKSSYENGDIYILCLHTSHWIRGKNMTNLKRILKSNSLKEFFFNIKRFILYFFKRSSLKMWDYLKQHIEFILKFHDIHFITFKDLLE